MLICRRSRRFDSPYISIGVSLAAVLAVMTCDLDVLLPVANTFAALTQFVILAAAIELRRSLPFMPRSAKGERMGVCTSWSVDRCLTV